MVSLLWAGCIVCVFMHVCVYTCVYCYVVLCGQDPSLVECCSLSTRERTRRRGFCQDHGLFLYRGQVICITHSYNIILSRDGKVSRLFPYFLYMVDSTKWPASVGLAQARPNNVQTMNVLLECLINWMKCTQCVQTIILIMAYLMYWLFSTLFSKIWC